MIPFPAHSILCVLVGSAVVWRGLTLFGELPMVPGRPARLLGLVMLLVGIAVCVGSALEWLFRWSGVRSQAGARARGLMADAIRLGRRRAGILAFAVVVGFVGLHVVKGPVIPCGVIPSDCHSYLSLVEALTFPDVRQVELQAAWEEADRIDGRDRWENYGSHHFMRILPSLIVRGTTYLGFTADQGFFLLSAGAMLAFALTLLLLVHSVSGSYTFGAGITLLILGADPRMTSALQDVYRSTEPMGFLVGALLIAATVKGHYRWVGSLAVTGVLVKQPLLVLGGLALLFLFLQPRERAERAEIAGWAALLSIVYLSLGFYFQAHESVARHMLPTGGVSSLAHNFVVHGGLWPFVGLFPLCLLAGREMLVVARRYWFIPVASAIIITQPIMRLGIPSGQTNLRRIMLHGVWPMYLLAALAIAQRTSGVTRAAGLGVLTLGAFFFDGRTTEVQLSWLALAAAACIFLARVPQARRFLWSMRWSIRT